MCVRDACITIKSGIPETGSLISFQGVAQIHIFRRLVSWSSLTEVLSKCVSYSCRVHHYCFVLTYRVNDNIMSRCWQ